MEQGHKNMRGSYLKPLIKIVQKPVFYVRIGKLIKLAKKVHEFHETLIHKNVLELPSSQIQF